MIDAFLAVALAVAPLNAGPAGQCSHETLAIRGTSVTLDLCAVPESRTASVATVALTATYSAKDASFTEHSTLRFIAGEGPARALQSVDLSQIGIAGILHMTLLYGGNEVSLEHALLTPGAVTIK
jgi:hypothetical protein